MQETMAVLENIESVKLILFFLMFNILNLFLICLITEGCIHMTSGTHGSQRQEIYMNLELYEVGNYLSYGLGTELWSSTKVVHTPTAEPSPHPGIIILHRELCYQEASRGTMFAISCQLEDEAEHKNHA